MKDQFAGCLMGQALGDALGFPVEGHLPGPCRAYVGGKVPGLKPGHMGRSPFVFGQYTDDTQLARELLCAWVEHGAFRPQAYAERLMLQFFEDRIVGRGRATEQAAQRLALGVPWAKAGTPTPSAGNGSAMRAGPVGLMCHGDWDALVHTACTQSRITHTDPRCLAGAVVIAGAVALALDKSLDPKDFLNTLEAHARPIDPCMADGLAALVHWITLEAPEALQQIRDFGRKEPQLEEWGGISPYVVPSVLWSLYSFLRSPNDLWACLMRAIWPGGDVDTTAAMTGAICGAYVGLEGFDDRSKDLVENLNDRGSWKSPALIHLAETAAEIQAGQRQLAKPEPDWAPPLASVAPSPQFRASVPLSLYKPKLFWDNTMRMIWGVTGFSESEALQIGAEILELEPSACSIVAVSVFFSTESGVDSEPWSPILAHRTSEAIAQQEGWVRVGNRASRASFRGLPYAVWRYKQQNWLCLQQGHWYIWVGPGCGSGRFLQRFGALRPERFKAGWRGLQVCISDLKVGLQDPFDNALGNWLYRLVGVLAETPRAGGFSLDKVPQGEAQVVCVSRVFEPVAAQGSRPPEHDPAWKSLGHLWEPLGYDDAVLQERMGTGYRFTGSGTAFEGPFQRRGPWTIEGELEPGELLMFLGEHSRFGKDGLKKVVRAAHLRCLLKSPCLLPVHDVVFASGRLALLVGTLPKLDLERFLKARAKGLGLSQALHIAGQVARGLFELNQAGPFGGAIHSGGAIHLHQIALDPYGNVMLKLPEFDLLLDLPTEMAKPPVRLRPPSHLCPAVLSLYRVLYTCLSLEPDWVGDPETYVSLGVHRPELSPQLVAEIDRALDWAGQDSGKIARAMYWARPATDELLVQLQEFRVVCSGA